MTLFKKRLFVEYPVPLQYSIWRGDGLYTEEVEDVDTMIESCLEELSSDLYKTEYIEAHGMSTVLPEGAFSVTSAKLSFQFQGNRNVKFSFDMPSRRCSVRFYPATITYRRKLLLEDLDTLQGDQLIYAKTYMLMKLAKKEYQILSAVKLDSTQGEINLDYLKEFVSEQETLFTRLKEEILIYGTSS